MYFAIRKSIVYRIEVFRVESAKRKAIRRNKIDGKKYYVIRLQDRYRVYNSLEVKELKRQKIFKRDMSYVEFSKHCVFTTS